MATFGVLFLLRSVTCGISRVIGLLLGILVGPSGRPWDVFGTYSAALAPHVTVAALGQGTVYLQPPRAALGQASVYLHSPRAGHVDLESGLAK